MAEKDKKHSKNTMLLFPIVILRVVAGTPVAESICIEGFKGIGAFPRWSMGKIGFLPQFWPQIVRFGATSTQFFL